MKRLLLALALAALAGYAIAQQQVQLRPGDGGPLWWNSTGVATLTGPLAVSGHLTNTSAAPALSSCGGAGLAITGSDAGGTVTVGSTPSTSCIITFATAFGTAPACVVSPASGVLAAFSYVVATDKITVTQTSTASNTIQYVCVGKS